MRPLTARSVLLSTLLGTHPPELPVRALVGVGELFGIAEGTVRVALSRLAAEGEVVADNGRYRLAANRLLERQRRQDESRTPPTRPWDGAWSTAVLRPEPRAAAERCELRAALASHRYAPLRNGTWTRPANLDSAAASTVTDRCWCFDGRFEGDDAILAAQLWDLPKWAHTATTLLAGMDVAASPAQRFTVAAAILHHLLTDPLLPDALLPDGWPGPQMRRTYEAFEAELAGLFARAVASANP
ncbi:MAG: PaaX family transcriptional regulator C-terminal domain-containing protein [Acidimicrobiales bacterium]